jgi:succinoglycan biosynthesis transport protein ExoP
MDKQIRAWSRLHSVDGGVGDAPQDESRSADDERMGSTKLLEILRRRSALITSITLGGSMLVLALALLLGPRYTAKAQLVVQDSRTVQRDTQVTTRGDGPDQATMQTQVTALASHDLLAGAVSQLRADAAFNATERRASTPLLEAMRADPAVIEELKRHLNVFQESGSHVISVAYTSRDPAEAAAVANKITDYYLAAGEDPSSLAPDQAISALNGKIADLRQEATALENAVVAYRSEHGINDASRTTVIDGNLGDLNRQISAAQSELAARQARYGELLASRGVSGDWEPLLAGRDAQGLVDLHGQVLAVLAGRQESIVATLRTPATGIGDSDSYRPLQDKVKNELDQALLKLLSERRVASAQVAALEARLTSVQRDSEDERLHDLVTAAAAAHHRYERLVQRRDELIERADDVTAAARLLSHAAVPRRASSLSPWLTLPPAFAAFLILGCMVAVARDRLDQRMYSANDVAAALGMRCAGFVPFSRGIIPTEGTVMGTGKEATPFLEALRGIFVSLQMATTNMRKPHIVLIASSVAGEGKTTLALGLAAYAVRMGAKVLLLNTDPPREADSPRPAGSPRPASEDLAMTDLLATDRARIVIIPTGQGMRLDCMPVTRGAAPERTSLYKSDDLASLLRSRWSDYDFIFIDSAPVLPTSEVRLLATIADQVLFAVRWGVTRRDDARAALALLRASGVRGARIAANISAVITQVNLDAYAGNRLANALRLLRRPFVRRVVPAT